MRLIDADELSKTIKETCLLAKPWDYVLIERVIADAPSIEPKRGEWVEDKYTRKCSVCGSTYWRRGGDTWNYCPNCGSRNGGEG